MTFSSPREQSQARMRQQWTEAFGRVVDGRPGPIIEVLDPASMARHLRPLMGGEFSQVLLPGLGTTDCAAVHYGEVPGTLEFQSSPRRAHIVRPAKLTVGAVEADPVQSFLVLDLAELPPVRLFGLQQEDLNRIQERGVQEMVELGRGDYEDRSIWDQGFISEDEDGTREPLPDTARLVIRWLRGRIMIVCKASRWNADRSLDGRHNALTIAEIRAIIEGSL